VALLLLTAAAYLYNLTASGWANSFYSAAVQAGSVSWKAFLFGSSDAGNSITVDKPPASLWVMALSVRLLGLNSFAILLPQVLMGVGTVGVVHATVRRYFTAAAGLIAGAVVALTPVAVLMFRFNNPDALLVLLMTLAAWATMRAVEAGSVRWMALAGAFIGFGFLAKSLQVLLVVPALGLAFLLLADTTWRRRLWGAVIGLAAMLLSAGWWVAIVELTPASQRPYIGGSQTNSFLELAFGYNGLGRLDGTEVGSVGGGAQRGPNSGTGSILRLLDSSVGGQISWLLPTALIFLVAGIALRGRAGRTDLRRAGYIVWGGWLIVTGLTFSLMQGIFHEYYTVALAPAIAALVGMGAVEAWERRPRFIGRLILALATGAAGMWAFVLLTRTTAYGTWLRASVLAGSLAAAAMLLGIDRVHRAAIPAIVAVALAAGLAGPAAYSVSTLSAPHTGSIVTAGPATGRMGGMPGGPGGGPSSMPGGQPPGTGLPPALPGGGPGMPGGQGAGGGQSGTPRSTGPGSAMGGLLDAQAPNTEVVAALSDGAAKYRWAAAAIGSQTAAGLQLGTGLPVMAVGGFNGSDPSPTLAQFQAYVAAGQIHYFAAGGPFGDQNGGSNAATEISQWVTTHYTSVAIGGSTFYDLSRPLSS
jgi:4-amino-4-deoxy-L-arabinose transferase-like glycosyltransferase